MAAEDDRLVRDYVTIKPLDLPRWRTSAISCPLCALTLRSAALHDEHLDSNITNVEFHVSCASKRPADCEIRMYVDIRDTPFPFLHRLRPRIHVTDYEDSWNNCRVSTTQHHNWSPAVATLARSWIDECSKTHQKCNHLQNSVKPAARRLPTRLLDVWPGAQELDNTSFSTNSIHDSPSLNLVNSSALPLDTEYVTLSHCWGSHSTVAWGQHPALTLIKADLDAFYVHAPLHESNSDHAQTFRDAIKVTRDLGYRYLWIDALCIIQDDTGDRTREIMNMDQIFSNAVLGISATASRDGRDGLLHDRNPLLISPLHGVHSEIENANNDNHHPSFGSEYIHHSFDIYSRRWQEDIELGALNKRGWVYQERNLAPRVLHFTPHEVYWECSSCAASETSPHCGRPACWIAAPKEAKNYDVFNNVTGPQKWKKLFTIWASIVETCTESKLSFERDRLVALSGIARRLSQVADIQDEDYLAGIWRPMILGQLLWVTRGPASTKLSTYQAPSWSWASLNGPVLFMLPRSEADYMVHPSFRVDLVDANLTHENEDHFGRLTAGYVRLCAALVKITFSTFWDDRTIQSGFISCSNTTHQTDVRLSMERNELTYSSSQLYMTLKLDDESSYFDFLSPLPNSNSGNTSSLWSFLFLWWTSQTQQLEPVFLMPFAVTDTLGEGLLLQRVKGERGQYRRIGIFLLTQNDEAFLDDCRRNGLQAEEYLERDDDGRYLVDII